MPEIKRLTHLTESAKLLAVLGTPEVPTVREPVDIQALIEDVIILHDDKAKAHNVELRYLKTQDPPRVFGDQAQIKQVLFNLIENGIKYTQSEQGEVIIKTETIQNKLQINIQDNGPGIAPEYLNQVWDVAYRALDAQTMKSAGSGLGLAIVKRIVEQHNGRVSVSSITGEGTKFSFTLPIYTPK